MTEKHVKITAVKGMVDVMPPETALWQLVESTANRVFGVYGYHEIRTPIVERTELFRRGVGESTAIVEKEMYSFTDQGDENLTLRPEATASVVRAHIESGAANQEPIAKYYYAGPMFRRERPQKGRQRQFYQIGCELFGADDALADAEVIAMADHFLKDLKVGDYAIELNSIGCAACRPAFRDALINFLSSHEKELCEDCIRRIAKNPLRVLDCKKGECAHIVENAPRISKYLCKDCDTHFSAVKDILKTLNVKFTVNEKIVRGLDYYMRTTFEFTTTKLGSQNAILAGGRYDGLVEELGGPKMPGIGFALGMERLTLLMAMSEREKIKEDVVYFAVMGDEAKKVAMPIIQTLRIDGVRVEWDYVGRSLKSQMRRADKLGAESVVIVGDDEVSKGTAVVRDMRAKTQHEVKLSELPQHFVHVGG